MPNAPQKPGIPPKTDTRGRNLLLFVGFVLFLHGFVAILLELVAVKVPYLLFLDAFGAIIGFFFKILLTVGGLIMAFMARIDDEAYDEHFDGPRQRP